MTETPKTPLARAAPGRIIGRRSASQGFRIVGPDNEPLMTRDRLPVDNGGFTNENLANLRANEINDYYAKRKSP